MTCSQGPVGDDPEIEGKILAGDWHDDDAEYVDEIVKPYAGDVEYPVRDLLPEPEPVGPAYPDILATWYGALDPAVQIDSFKMMPRDPTRQRLIVLSSADLIITGEKVSGDEYPRILANSFFTLEEYTGELWGRIPSATSGTVTVSCWAVIS